MLTGVSKRITLGRFGIIAPEAARALAKGHLHAVTIGHDPASMKADQRKAMRVSELCDLYIENVTRLPGRGGKIKKQSTISGDRGRINRHIKPLIGASAVIGLTSRDIQRMHADIAEGKTAVARPDKGRCGFVTGGPVAASRTVGLFLGLF